MPRAATTSDAFNAVAEPRRREIIDFLAQSSVHETVLGGHAVGELVIKLKMPHRRFQSIWACSGKLGW